MWKNFTKTTPGRRIKDAGTAIVEYENSVDTRTEISEMSSLVWENLYRVLEFAFVNYHRDVRKAMADIRMRLNDRVAGLLLCELCRDWRAAGWGWLDAVGIYMIYEEARRCVEAELFVCMHV